MEALRQLDHRSARPVGPLFASHVRVGARSRTGRLLRLPLIVGGKLLVILGTTATIVSLVLLPVFLASHVVGDEPVELEGWVMLGAFGGAGLVGIFVGHVSVRGSRHLVLFLRKFGYRDASAVTSYAAERVMGRTWRLVTLDDNATTSPIGVSPGLRRRANIIGFGGLFLMLGSAAAIAYWIAVGGLARFLSELPDDGGLAPLILAFGVVGLLALYTSCISAWMTRRAVMRADRSATWLMSDRRQVTSISARIAEQAHRVYAPGLFVVRSSDRVWKQAVNSLARHADVVMIDISRPTENLLWEIRELSLRTDVRLALVCAADSAAELQQHPDGPRQQALHVLLDGEEVLVYGTGPGEVKDFARSLRNKLDHAARERH